jgi:small subunit ribosomal protein S21
LRIDIGREKTNLRVHLFSEQPRVRNCLATRKEVSSLTEIKLKKGEPVERALRRLKKKVDREGTLKIVRSHRTFEKPSEKRRRKQKVARFSAMLTARYADL